MNDLVREERKLERMPKVRDPPAQLEQRVHRPKFVSGTVEQPKLKAVMTAWDEMQVAKNFPGLHNVPYVAGMNVTNLPTTTFSVSQTVSDANVYGSAPVVPLGSAPYTIIMWCPSMTAFLGPGGAGGIPTVDKIGGMVIKQIEAADMTTQWITRGIFGELLSAQSMTEVYGSDLMGFSSGGYVFAAEA